MPSRSNKFHYATADRDYGDFAGGKVFYSLPGHPALPARLASEIFQRCLARRGKGGPCTVYDPCCGGAYHLVTLGFLHAEQLAAIFASDIDPVAVDLARRNLGLLSVGGLEARMAQIEAMLGAYGKTSHAEALESARRFRRQLEERPAIGCHLFQADATDGEALRRQFERLEGCGPGSVEVVISDVPYGWFSSWRVAESAGEPATPPVERMLGALLPVLKTEAVVAIAADKAQKVQHERYQRLERFQIGKRQVVLLSKK